MFQLNNDQLNVGASKIDFLNFGFGFGFGFGGIPNLIKIVKPTIRSNCGLLHFK
jgi:hypothetical protein